MKLTKKQKQEVQYLQHFFTFTATDEEINDYIASTVHGVTCENDKLSNNPLRHAKARLNLTIAMWNEDISTGLISIDELLEDKNLQYPYIQKIILKLRPHYTGKINEIVRSNIWNIINRKIVCA